MHLRFQIKFMVLSSIINHLWTDIDEKSLKTEILGDFWSVKLIFIFYKGTLKWYFSKFYYVDLAHYTKLLATRPLVCKILAFYYIFEQDW